MDMDLDELIHAETNSLQEFPTIDINDIFWKIIKEKKQKNGLKKV